MNSAGISRDRTSVVTAWTTPSENHLCHENEALNSQWTGLEIPPRFGTAIQKRIDEYDISFGPFADAGGLNATPPWR